MPLIDWIILNLVLHGLLVPLNALRLWSARTYYKLPRQLNSLDRHHKELQRVERGIFCSFLAFIAYWSLCFTPQGIGTSTQYELAMAIYFLYVVNFTMLVVLIVYRFSMLNSKPVSGLKYGIHFKYDFLQFMKEMVFGPFRRH